MQHDYALVNFPHRIFSYTFIWAYRLQWQRHFESFCAWLRNTIVLHYFPSWYVGPHALNLYMCTGAKYVLRDDQHVDHVQSDLRKVRGRSQHSGHLLWTLQLSPIEHGQGKRWAWSFRIFINIACVLSFPGPRTGACDTNTRTCEVHAWCPTEKENRTYT